MRPLLFRPPVFLAGSTRLFSGSDFVISAKSETVMNLRPGLVGLNFLVGIYVTSFLAEMRQHFSRSNLGPLEDLDRLALAQLHDRLLPAGPAAADHPAPLRLGTDLDDVDRLDLHPEELLDRLPDRVLCASWCTRNEYFRS